MSETVEPLSKQNKYDNSHKAGKKEQRRITKWLCEAEEEQNTGLPIGRKRKGKEREMQQRIYAEARAAKVDCLARARTFLREFNEAEAEPTPPMSDPISSGETTPREEDPISDEETDAPMEMAAAAAPAAHERSVSPGTQNTRPTVCCKRVRVRRRSGVWDLSTCRVSLHQRQRRRRMRARPAARSAGVSARYVSLVSRRYGAF